MKQILFLILLTWLLCGCNPEPIPESQPTTEAATEPISETVDISEELMDPVQTILDSMTTEEKVGQLFLARCPEENQAEQVSAYHLGGFILFDRDLEGESVDSLREKIASYQAAADVPLLIAVDEEGGTVCRVSNKTAFRPERFPSPRSLYNLGGMELVLSMEAEKAYLLSVLGINVSMGPVCDISTQPDAFMYSRSLGQSPEITRAFAAGTVERMRQYHVGSVLKHYPGYGNNADTHTGIAVDDRSLEQLEAADLIPFQWECDAILISHNIVNALDSELPASLSPEVHDYLRKQGFTGVIVTDELSMGAITERFGTEEAAVQAVLAGNDLLCTTDYITQYHAILQAVEDGTISETKLNAAAYRVLEWKQQLGLWSH